MERNLATGSDKDPRKDGIQWLPSTTMMALNLLRILANDQASCVQ